jgi:hypothetical protein
VPFHAWAPDAYEGASVPVTAYMATIVKAGVLLAVVRLFAAAPVTGAHRRPARRLLPLASMIWGNLAAIRQTSFRRMIAYSSIAHAGFLFFAMLGAGAGTRPGGAVLRARLRADERCWRSRRCRTAATIVPATGWNSLKGLYHRQSVCRADDGAGDAVAGRHPAAARLRRQVPDLQERDRGRLHGFGGRSAWSRATSASTSTCA